MKTVAKQIYLLWVFLLLYVPFSLGQEIESKTFKIAYNNEGITRLLDKSDPFNSSFINGRWGNNIVNYKVKDGFWQKNRKRVNSLVVDKNTLIYSDTTVGNTLSIGNIFTLKDKQVDSNIRIKNSGIR